MASTPTDQVRLLIADVSTDPDKRVLTDEQIQTYLDLEGQVVKAAAADALDAIAVSELLVSKVIRTQDLQTDGSKVAAELRARAAELRAQVADDDQADIFDVIPPARRCWPELTEPEVWGL